MAVGVFFLFGGFFIARSCESHPHARQFFSLRCRRIFPQLAFVILLSAFVMGPLMTTRPLTLYFADPQTYHYLFNIALVPVHALPGVFASTPYGPDVNGVLWTLPVEFACYVLCYVGFRVTSFDRRKVALLSVPIAMMTAIYLVGFHLAFLSVVRAVLLFYLGVLCWVYRSSLTLSMRGGVLSIILLVVLISLRLDVLAMLVFFPYACLWVVFSPGLRGAGARFRTKERSYGIYLWGWPVQQLLVSFWPWQPMHPLVNALIGCVLAFGMGALSDAIVEQGILGAISRHKKVKAQG
jgi:peptidoglycan/LPS O-acetylase OafA/YrhL